MELMEMEDINCNEKKCTGDFIPLRSAPTDYQENKENQIKCLGYSRNKILTIITCVLCAFTMGFLLLIFYWKPNWRLKMMYSRCDLQDAEAALIQDIYCREHVKFIQRHELDEEKREITITESRGILKRETVIDNEIRFFCYQNMKYIWDPANSTFFLLRSPELKATCAEFHERFQAGLSTKEVETRQEIFGLNKITITVKPIFVMLIQEVLNPFYVFQVYSVSVWMAFEYWNFAVCIIIMTIISLTTTLYVTRKQSKTLRKMAESFSDVTVLRPDEGTVRKTEDQLVPGDVIVIPPRGCTMTCDAVLISGTCIVNESMLTGESVPVTKVSLSSENTTTVQREIYSPETHKRHTLFCGTQVIQTRQSGNEMAKAVIVQTGFSTKKGTLVRSILYPRPMEIKLYRDAMMFVASYITLAFIGIIYSTCVLIANRTSPRLIVLLTLDSITVAIQPLLPVALTIGMLYAQLRLKKKGIFCISPQRINLSGILDVVCFDKTGTLTENGLDLLGFHRVTTNTFLPIETAANLLLSCPFLHTMATCHSLAVIDGTLLGDPMDLKMFEATGCSLEETQENSNRDGTQQITRVIPSATSDKHMSPFAILKQFTFSSSLQRMSVIAQSETSNQLAGFVKGSPEMVRMLCKPGSIPDKVDSLLTKYTSEGLRVLALAWKPLGDVTSNDFNNISRDELESNLIFLGILIWQNRLKSESAAVINELQMSNIRTIMVTGDNILTATSVADKCGMLSPEDTIIQVNMPIEEGTSNQLEYKMLSRDEHNRDVHVEGEPNEEYCLEPHHGKTGKDHYCLDGKTFDFIQEHCPDALPSILVKGTVFARMTPNQKQHLVEALQQLEYCVGMCGDGANDCGALKTAHAGISLSEAEASVASPFTSKIANITCVPMIIKEGRAALVTSFGLFKFIALYTCIMYVAVNITKKFGSYPSSLMFTVWDIAIATTIVLLMSRSGPYDEICKTTPPTRLLRAPNMFSLASHIFVLTATQIASVFLVQSQTWFIPFIPDPDEARLASLETTVVFLVANFQYVMYGILFTPGRPYRQPITANPLYIVDLILVTLLCLFLLFAPLSGLESFMTMEHIPEVKFRFKILALCFGNCLVSFVIELFIIPRVSVQKMLRCWRRERKQKYQEISQIANHDLQVAWHDV
ncbi:polyamine-transporting ATPase 13A3-like [Amphiura filiformis]|uniref:polyamine-transporting ATPase 13A3-like n=1 Tax=Amphiura filiformis TaxID=82378 RepID=UPI003B20DACD